MPLQILKVSSTHLAAAQENIDQIQSSTDIGGQALAGYQILMRETIVSRLVKVHEAL